MQRLEVSLHAEDRMIERGISMEDLEDGLTMAKQRPNPGGIAFVSKELVVVTDREKTVVKTVWWRSEFEESERTYPRILALA